MWRRDSRVVFAVFSVALCVQAADLPGAPPQAGRFSSLIARGASDADLDTAYGCSGCPVVLISIDTLRADHLGAYGYGKPTSPSIDRFAADSVLFANAIAAAPSTLRSHSSMFTSVHPYQHGARTRPPVPLPEEALTIAELLRGEGYTTAAFTSGGQLDPVYGIAQGFDVYDIQGQRRFREVVEDALAWVDRAAPERLFLFLHTYEVHAPYDPPQEYLDLLPTADGSDTAGPVSIDTIDRLNRVIESDRSLDSADLARVVHAYDGEIRSVDSGFAALLQRLRQRGLYDASLILLTADHGEEFGEHDVIGRHSHTLHDEVVKVPLVVKFPRTAFAGSRIEAQVRGIDLAPTITDVVGIDAPGSFEGLSLVGAITGADAVVRWSLSERGGESPSFALRTDRWKLYDGRLFDLLADPGERADVSDRYPAVREAMETRLADALTLPAVGEAETVEPSEEVLRQLRALGYIR